MTDFVMLDYEKAVVNPAEAMAMTVINLLSGDAEKAKEVMAKSRLRVNKAQYVALQDRRLTEELYEG